ncbi:sensor histidine kinase [Nonomuraea gerenzanensis]|uniref:histidine kinase n=1 Tax=Nonomuraea gerenzanensis TaxID=93944 RepID=A0A1M4E001_9ACTN|nr:CHASE3 domain-containing protein [Nonomuraea gerenzanensis]UBU14417.1 CHASE3 domain-containing protein [Nonomuraea gerenzanensis]SBO92131.1 Phytochrome, two-component sensor histidine kinase; cyanobacterial phytochrome 1 [Nonomuraea gerenzanensis]
MTAPVRKGRLLTDASRLRRLTVHGWFLVMIAALTVLTAVCAVTGAVMIDRTSSLSDQLTTRISPAAIEASQMQKALIDQETGVRGFLLTGREEFLQPYAEGLAAERRSRAQVAADIADRPGLLRELNTISAKAAAWRSEYAEPMTAERRDGGTVPAAAVEAGKRAFDEIRVLLERQNSRLAQLRVTSRDELSQAERVRNWAFLAMLVLFPLAMVGMAVLLRRAIGRPLDQLRIASREIAAGDFERVIPARGPADIREVAEDVDLMRVRIVQALGDSHRQQVQLREQAADLDAQAVELRRSNAELEQFAYVASHDLQEPLRKVATFCQLLEKRYGEVLDERGKQYIRFAVDGATRMQVLINDLLRFSRVGRVYDDREPVDLGESLEKVIDDLSAPIEESGASFERPDKLPTIVGDPTMLRLLWQNLISNAIKFHDPARAPLIRIGCEPDEDGWKFSVSDNGIGVEPEFADKIFVIFQRLHSREQYSGTGIGLAMCKKIVENHGGRIWLDTGYTGGARLCFTLPASTVPARSGTEHEGSSS